MMLVDVLLRWIVGIAFLFLALATSLAAMSPGRAIASQSERPTVSVMTINVGNGLVPPERLVDYLRGVDADIVGLQEVTSETEEALHRDLDDVYRYREIRGLGIPGMALLSRFPINSVEWLELSQDRPDLLATIDMNGQSVTVLVAHPLPPRLSLSGLEPRPGATEQFERILEIAERVDGPFILLGDLNITPLQDRYGELVEIGLIDTFGSVGVGAGFTYPASLPATGEADWALGLLPVTPFIRIDYIWVSGHWQPVSASLGRDIGSDHLPVVVSIILTDSGAAIARP